MLRHVHALLSRRGVPMDRVHYEFFGPAALAA
jgi:nitric oxide dioxygenase